MAWNSADGGGGGASKALHAEHLPALLQTVVGGPVAQWKVDTSEWHLLQTLLRQCDGAVTQAGRVVAIRRATDDMLGAHLLPRACLGRGARHGDR